MSTYSNRNYRKIYEKHYGSIPKDSNGRTYDIHHIDGDHSNCDPSNLKAVTIQEHYDIHYSQQDWAACQAIAMRLVLRPDEISSLATNAAIKRVVDGTHHFVGGEIQRKNTIRRTEDGLNPFSGGQIQSRSNQERLKNGTHHLLRRADGTSVASDLVKSGKLNLLGSEHSKKMLENGCHPSQLRVSCVDCHTECSIGNFKRWHGDKCRSLC